MPKTSRHGTWRPINCGNRGDWFSYSSLRNTSLLLLSSSKMSKRMPQIQTYTSSLMSKQSWYVKAIHSCRSVRYALYYSNELTNSKRHRNFQRASLTNIASRNLSPSWNEMLVLQLKLSQRESWGGKWHVIYFNFEIIWIPVTEKLGA